MVWTIDLELVYCASLPWVTLRDSMYLSRKPNTELVSLKRTVLKVTGIIAFVMFLTVKWRAYVSRPLLETTES